MTTITEGMTPTEFNNAISDNFYSLVSAGPLTYNDFSPNTFTSDVPGEINDSFVALGIIESNPVAIGQRGGTFINSLNASFANTTLPASVLDYFILLGDYNMGNAPIDHSDCDILNKIIGNRHPKHLIGIGDNEDDSTYTAAWILKALERYTSRGILHSAGGNHDTDADGTRTSFDSVLDGGGYRKVTVGLVDFFIHDAYMLEDESGYAICTDGGGTGCNFLSTRTLNEWQISTQGVWLLAQIAASTNIWKVFVSHPPSWSSGPVWAYGDAPGMRWDYAALGIDLVITGHRHFYERLLIPTGSGNVPHINLGPVTGGPYDSLAVAIATSVKIVTNLPASSRYDANCAKGFLIELTITANQLQLDISGINASYDIVTGIDQLILNK